MIILMIIMKRTETKRGNSTEFKSSSNTYYKCFFFVIVIRAGTSENRLALNWTCLFPSLHYLSSMPLALGKITVIINDVSNSVILADIMRGDNRLGVFMVIYR